MHKRHLCGDKKKKCNFLRVWYYGFLFDMASKATNILHSVRLWCCGTGVTKQHGRKNCTDAAVRLGCAVYQWKVLHNHNRVNKISSNSLSVSWEFIQCLLFCKEDYRVQMLRSSTSPSKAEGCAAFVEDFLFLRIFFTSRCDKNQALSCLIPNLLFLKENIPLFCAVGQSLCQLCGEQTCMAQSSQKSSRAPTLL